MPALAAPLAADKLDAWEAWVGELNGPRKPDGSFLVLAIHEGPGADSFLANVASSSHDFDQWFLGAVADLHGMDTTGPMPPMAARKRSRGWVRIRRTTEASS